jgi:uncharacterized membrane protein YcaP (DUF421 family)
MESVIRGLAVYLLLMVIFRIAGKRTLAQMTTFDLILLLIISETTQQAMVDSDHSLTNAFLLILTLVSVSVLLSLLKQRWQWLERLIESSPVLIMEEGRLYKDRMDKLRVDQGDIMESARSQEGLRRMDELDYAVVERNGEVTVISKQSEE